MPNTAPIPVTQPGGACPVVFSGGVVASVHPGNLLPRRVQAAYIAILGVLTLLGSFTVDAYLPAFPQIETDLSVQPSAVQFTLTAALLGTAVGQAVVGPWSDRIGRRPPLILAAIVHVVASVGSALAQDIVTLSVSRALQGLGAAAGGVVAIALLRDLFGGKALVRGFARLALVGALGPIFAPMLGGYLLKVMSWRGVLWVICAYGLLVGVAVIIGVKETLELAKLRKQRRSLAVAEYSISPPADGQSFRVSVRALFRDPVYVGTLVISMMTTCIAWAYLSSAPFLVQQVYHLEPWQLANIFVSNAVIGVIHNQIVARMLRGKTSPFTLMLAGALGLVASSGLLIVFAMHNIGVWGIIVPAWLMWMSVITIGNPVSVLALLEHPKEAGTAASFGGTLVTIVAAAVTPLSGMFSTTSPLPMGLMQVSATIGVFAVLFTLMRPSRLPELTP